VTIHEDYKNHVTDDEQNRVNVQFFVATFHTRLGTQEQRVSRETVHEMDPVGNDTRQYHISFFYLYFVPGKIIFLKILKKYKNIMKYTLEKKTFKILK